MKILHFSSFENEGGAAKAAKQLHLSLIKKGIGSTMIVSKKTTMIESIVELAPKSRMYGRLTRSLRVRIDSFLLFFYIKKSNTPWTIGWLSNKSLQMTQISRPYVTHLHWIGSGYMSLNDISKMHNRFVWTLHDAWAFTGGCHVVGLCKKFVDGCGRCPQLGSSFNLDLSRLGVMRKLKIYDGKNPIFIAPSYWMASQARSSILLKNKDIRVIPNGVDVTCFKPRDKELMRTILNIPLNKKILLFGANNLLTDKNKGFIKVKKILEILKENKYKDNIEVVIFGQSNDISLDLGFPTIYLGRIDSPEEMAQIYSAADVLCVTSLQESFGLVALEGMSCGIPVVCFRTSGLVDIVDHGITGFLAKPYCEENFASYVEIILKDVELSNKMSAASRSRAKEYFDQSKVVEQYVEVYKEVLGSSEN